MAKTAHTARDTAMGAGRYMGSPLEREDRIELFRRQTAVIAADNACHDWLAAQGSEFTGFAPPRLLDALHEAEDRLAAHKRMMAKLRFEDET